MTAAVVIGLAVAACILVYGGVALENKRFKQYKYFDERVREQSALGRWFAEDGQYETATSCHDMGVEYVRLRQLAADTLSEYYLSKAVERNKVTHREVDELLNQRRRHNVV